MEPIQKNKYTRYLFETLFFCLFSFGWSCNTNNDKLSKTSKYIVPTYTSLHIVATSDTIRFKLHESMYNDIKSFSTFSTESQEYISFHDARSNTLNVYEIFTQSLVTRIDLKKNFAPKKLAKSSAFMLRKDSIILYNNEDIYMINNNGDIIQKISISKLPYNISPKINMKCIPFLKGTTLYFGLQSSETLMYKKKFSKKIPLICAIDLLNSQTSFYYHYPEIYKKKNWGYYFSNYSYCINEKGNLVFSFPADSNIYETNLKTFNIEYTGRSSHDKDIAQKYTTDFTSVTEDFSAFQKQQSYGQIYFNPKTGYYLRIFRNNKESGINNQKNKSIVILDKNLRIVGESTIEDQTFLNSTFTNSKGELYTRIMNKDEYNLNFLKLKIIQ